MAQLQWFSRDYIIERGKDSCSDMFLRQITTSRREKSYKVTFSIVETLEYLIVRVIVQRWITPNNNNLLIHFRSVIQIQFHTIFTVGRAK